MTAPLVLMLAGKPPGQRRLDRITAALTGAGSHVALVCYRDVPELPQGLAPGEARSVTAHAPELGPAFRRELRAAQPRDRFAVHVAHDLWVRQRISDTLAVFALDDVAHRAAQRLQAEHPLLRTVTSLDEAIDALGGRPGRLARLRRRALSKRTRHPADSLHAARDEALKLLEAGDQPGAERSVNRALARLADPRQRADLLGDLAHATLARAKEPGLLVETVAAELAVADRHLVAGRTAEAAASFEEAMGTAFHRAAHFDGLTSPLAADPAGFTRPLRDSTVMQRLRAPRGRAVPAPARAADVCGRPHRVLLATWSNANFLAEIGDYVHSLPGVQVRHLELREVTELVPYVRSPRLIAEELLSGKRGLGDLVETHLRRHLAWADVVFVDWFTATPALLTIADPRDTRVIVRLHSYEAFTLWPHLADVSRIDDVVFVSEHLRDLAVAAVPALQGRPAPRLHVHPLALRLDEFARPKQTAEARFTLAMVGWSAVAKDPLWALELMRRLHERDRRYRLLLFGADFDDRASGMAEKYGAELWRALEPLETVGAVQRRGHTDDVATALQEVGVLLSTSVREGCHTAVIEGAASGAVPVVRDWPFFAGRPHGPRTLYPAEWVVDSVEQAVDRILAATATEGTWRKAADTAQAEALARWDWPAVRPGYDRLLLNPRDR